MRYRIDDLHAAARIRFAALELFAQQGAAATSLRQIAEAAGVSLGALSHHYPSKADLEASVRDFVRDQIRSAVTAPAMAPTPLEEARRRRDSFHALLAEQPAIGGYLRHELAGRGGSLSLEEYFASIRAEMELLTAAGYLRPLPDPEMGVLVYQLLALLPVLLSDLISDAVGVDLSTPEGLRRWREAELDLLANGLFPPDHRRRSAGAGRERRASSAARTDTPPTRKAKRA